MTATVRPQSESQRAAVVEVAVTRGGPDGFSRGRSGGGLALGLTSWDKA